MAILNSPARNERVPSTLVATAAVGAALGALASWVTAKSRLAERRSPPEGRFVTVDGVRLHYLDEGQGPPVVLLHGNSVYSKDFVVSGLVRRLAKNHRVVAFDRPGFGHSARTRDRLWTAASQAELVHAAFEPLGIDQPIVLGHSWGTLVALELALRASVAVQRLVLVSGYYFPKPRLDVVLAAPLAIPVLGDVLRYTVSPIAARLMLNRTVKAMFSPQPVPPDFVQALSRELLVRPAQIRANAEDAALMIPAAVNLQKRYMEIVAPTAIYAGEEDHVVNPEAHAGRLHSQMRNSTLSIVPGAGHMVHYAAADDIVASVNAIP